MRIIVECKSCGTQVTVPEKLAGKKARCQCGASFTIPEATPQRAARGRRRTSGVVSAQEEGHHVGLSQTAAPGGGWWQFVLFGGMILAAIIIVIIIINSGDDAPAPSVAGAGPSADTSPPETSKPARKSISAVDPLTLVPANAIGVGYIDIEQLAEAGLLDKLLGEELSGVLAAAKLDPHKHLARAAIIMREEGCALVVAGKFLQPSVIYNALDRGKKAEVYKKYKLATSPHGETVSVLDNKVLVIGHEQVAKAVIDCFKRQAPAMPEEAPLLARVKDLRDDAFWLTFDVPGASDGDVPPPGVSAITISGKSSQDACRISARLACKDAATALKLKKDFAAAVPSLVMLVSGRNENAEDTITELARGVNAKAQNSTLFLELAANQEQVARLKLSAEEIVRVQKTLVHFDEPTETPPTPPTLDPPRVDDGGYNPLD